MSQEETAVPKAAGLPHGGSQEWPGLPHWGLRSGLICHTRVSGAVWSPGGHCATDFISARRETDQLG